MRALVSLIILKLITANGSMLYRFKFVFWLLNGHLERREVFTGRACSRLLLFNESSFKHFRVQIG